MNMFPLRKEYPESPKDSTTNANNEDRPISPFDINKRNSKYNGDSDKLQGKKDILLASRIKEIPAKEQRKIRNYLNIEREKNGDQEISRYNIKPGDDDFDPELADLIVQEYNGIRVSAKVAQYTPKTVQRQFSKIPTEVKKKIMDSLGLTFGKVGDYTTENKKRILKEFKVNYPHEHLKTK